MHHLPRFIFSRNNSAESMDSSRRMVKAKPRLDRLNAAVGIDCKDSSSSSSSFSSLVDLSPSSPTSSLVTRSPGLAGCVSFRIDGNEGELDQIYQFLNLSGPDDLGISTAAWKESKLLSFSNVLPKIRPLELYSMKRPGDENDDQLNLAAADSVRDVKLVGSETAGIKGDRPAVLTAPGPMKLRTVDDECTTRDFLPQFAPEMETGTPGKAGRQPGPSSSSSDVDDDDDEEAEEDEEEEENADRKPVIGNEDGNVLPAGEAALTTKNDDDTSGSFSHLSPMERFKRITASWQKGKLLGRGSYGSVYEGISG